MRHVSAEMILAVLLGASCTVSLAANNQKQTAPSRPPSGNSGNGGSHGSSGGGGTAIHNPGASYNGGGSNHSTTNTHAVSSFGGSHSNTTNSGAHANTSSGGSHITTTNSGAHANTANSGSHGSTGAPGVVPPHNAQPGTGGSTPPHIPTPGTSTGSSGYQPGSSSSGPPHPGNGTSTGHGPLGTGSGASTHTGTGPLGTGAGTHGATTTGTGAGTHGATTTGGTGAGTHGATTNSGTGAGTHGATTIGTGAGTHGATTNSGTGAGTHGATTNSGTGAGTHGATTNSGTGAGTHGANTAGAGTHAWGSGGGGGVHGNTIAGSHSANAAHVQVHGGTTILAHNTHESISHSGNAIRRRGDGHPSDVHNVSRGMDIHHGLNGGRSISVVRPDHSRVMYERGRPGFVQRPYNYHGHDFERRSYFYHGHAYSHFYHGYGYRGLSLNVYGPSFYYGPRFYGWAYNPWREPIHYGWGWGGNPWYHHYGYYFAPYPVYPSAAFWLTDYLISADLAQAYAAQTDAGEVDGAAPAAGGPPMLTPDVKQQIADEVRNQLALENQEAQQNAQHQDVDPGSSGIARMLSDGHSHVFVVGSAMDVVDANQNECALSDGDVLAMQNPPPGDATAADVVVLASKGGQECQKSDTVSVSFDDLQEMQNHMRENIDQGLQELKDKQGQGGMPAAPDAAQQAPAQYAAVAPPADSNVSTELQQQAGQADQAETEVTKDVSQQQ